MCCNVCVVSKTMCIFRRLGGVIYLAPSNKTALACRALDTVHIEGIRRSSSHTRGSDRSLCQQLLPPDIRKSIYDCRPHWSQAYPLQKQKQKQK